MVALPLSLIDWCVSSFVEAAGTTTVDGGSHYSYGGLVRWKISDWKLSLTMLGSRIARLKVSTRLVRLCSILTLYCSEFTM